MKTRAQLLQKNIAWLKRWTSTKIMVEGHADSRGTNEYNLALAERRAAAVRDYLVSLGLAADRVTIVSKGEEQPGVLGRDRSLLAAEPPRSFQLHREVASSCQPVRSAAADHRLLAVGGVARRGSRIGAAMIGRPTTM